MAIDVPKCFGPSKLSDLPKKPGRLSNTPSEAQYGAEWYRYSSSVLKGNILWAPESGDHGKGRGVINFYLANSKWGFEFTRERSEPRTHYKRFLVGDLLPLDTIKRSHRLPIIGFPKQPTVKHHGKPPFWVYQVEAENPDLWE